MIVSFVSTFALYVLAAIFVRKPLGLNFIFEANNIMISLYLVAIAWLPFYLFNLVYKKYFPETHNRV
jgi:hypothetical protein